MTDPAKVYCLQAIANSSYQLNEDLLVILHVLKHRQKEAPFEEHDKASVQAIYAWLAQISLPSPEFASALNTRYSATGKLSSNFFIFPVLNSNFLQKRRTTNYRPH